MGGARLLIALSLSLFVSLLFPPKPGTSRPPPRPSSNAYWLSNVGKQAPSFQAAEPPSFVLGTGSFAPGTENGQKVPSRGQRLAAKVSHVSSVTHVSHISFFLLVTCVSTYRFQNICMAPSPCSYFYFRRCSISHGLESEHDFFTPLIPSLFPG